MLHRNVTESSLMAESHQNRCGRTRPGYWQRILPFQLSAGIRIVSDTQTAFAIGAHPDDIEFNMAGTLSLLAQAGFEPHMMNVSRSNLDSNELPQDEIVADAFAGSTERRPGD